MPNAPIMFKRATRDLTWLRLALEGPAGSGKTYTALELATLLVQMTGVDRPICAVDTEHGSASKYADIFTFDTFPMDPPYHPDRFVEAIQAAVDYGAYVLVIDSLSHAWNGTGGLLEIVDRLSSQNGPNKGNSYAAWGRATPIQNKLVDAILAAPIHIIATMRSKMDYSAEKNERTGKLEVRKLGMAPIQRDGFDYEFDIIGSMDVDNNVQFTKSRCSTLQGQTYHQPSRQVATILHNWIHSPDAARAAAERVPAAQRQPSITPAVRAATPQPVVSAPSEDEPIDFGDEAANLLPAGVTATVTPVNVPAAELTPTEHAQLDVIDQFDGSPLLLNTQAEPSRPERPGYGRPTLTGE
jgi:hypothetical protein